MERITDFHDYALYKFTFTLHLHYNEKNSKLRPPLLYNTKEDHKEAELDRLTKRRHRPAQHLQLCTRAAEVGFKKLDFYVFKNLKPQQSEF